MARTGYVLVASTLAFIVLFLLLWRTLSNSGKSKCCCCLEDKTTLPVSGSLPSDACTALKMERKLVLALAYNLVQGIRTDLSNLIPSKWTISFPFEDGSKIALQENMGNEMKWMSITQPICTGAAPTLITGVTATGDFNVNIFNIGGMGYFTLSNYDSNGKVTTSTTFKAMFGFGISILFQLCPTPTIKAVSIIPGASYFEGTTFVTPVVPTPGNNSNNSNNPFNPNQPSCLGCMDMVDVGTVNPSQPSVDKIAGLLENLRGDLESVLGANLHKLVGKAVTIQEDACMLCQLNSTASPPPTPWPTGTMPSTKQFESAMTTGGSFPCGINATSPGERELMTKLICENLTAAIADLAPASVDVNYTKQVVDKSIKMFHDGYVRANVTVGSISGINNLIISSIEDWAFDDTNLYMKIVGRTPVNDPLTGNLSWFDETRDPGSGTRHSTSLTETISVHAKLAFWISMPIHMGQITSAVSGNGLDMSISIDPSDLEFINQGKGPYAYKLTASSVDIYNSVKKFTAALDHNIHQLGTLKFIQGVLDVLTFGAANPLFSESFDNDIINMIALEQTQSALQKKVAPFIIKTFIQKIQPALKALNLPGIPLPIINLPSILTKKFSSMMNGALSVNNTTTVVSFKHEENDGWVPVFPRIYGLNGNFYLTITVENKTTNPSTYMTFLILCKFAVGGINASPIVPYKSGDSIPKDALWYMDFLTAGGVNMYTALPEKEFMYKLDYIA